MELGNLIFGNSRGEYPIPDRESYQNEFCRLYWETENNPYGFDMYSEFENDVFYHFPYYWGDCTCGFEEKDWEWCEKHQHKNECFQVKLSHFDEEWEKSLKKKWGDEYIYALDKFAKENGYTGWEGSGIYCDCGLYKAYEEWRKENDHDPNCPIVRPNFLHKPSGLQIKWYKYPLRDSYTNKEISLEELKAIINECIKSVNKK